MIELGFGYYGIVTMIVVILLTFTNIIPLYGFFTKRWKGLAIGCLLQPFAIALICLVAVLGVYFHQKKLLRKYREAAMVTVRKADDKGNAQIWYLKPDEECFYEYKEKGQRDAHFLSYNNIKLFDVIPLDSFAVCVDDKIVVRFDMEKHKVTAKEYDEQIDVANVDWDKVKLFFQKHP